MTLPKLHVRFPSSLLNQHALSEGGVLALVLAGKVIHFKGRAVKKVENKS